MEVIEHPIVEVLPALTPVLVDEPVALDRASLVWCPHPLASHGREICFEPCKRGETLWHYLDRVRPEILDAQCILFVGDREVPRHLWHLVRVHPGVIISARAVALGGNDEGGSNVGRTIGLIVVAIVSAYIGNYYGAYYGIAAAFFGNYAVNALFPVQAPSLKKLGGAGDSSPTYSLSGGSNRARPMEPVAIVLGTHLMFPDLAGKPYTLIRGDQEYLYMLFDWGFGQPSITGMRIGETPITDYEEVRIFTERGAAPAGFPSNVDTQAGGELRYADGFMLRTTSPDTTAISFDLSALLFRVGKTDLEGAAVTIQADYRPVGGGDDQWQPLTYHEVPNYYPSYWSRGYWVNYLEDDSTGGSAGDGDSDAAPGDGFGGGGTSGGGGFGSDSGSGQNSDGGWSA